jgi:hypothetical protein
MSAMLLLCLLFTGMVCFMSNIFMTHSPILFSSPTLVLNLDVLDVPVPEKRHKVKSVGYISILKM